MRTGGHPRYDFSQLLTLSVLRKIIIPRLYGALIGRRGTHGRPFHKGKVDFHDSSTQQVATASSPAARVSTLDLPFCCLHKQPLAAFVLFCAVYLHALHPPTHPVFCTFTHPASLKPQSSVRHLALRLHSRGRPFRHSLCTCSTLGLRRRREHWGLRLVVFAGGSGNVSGGLWG